MEQKVKIWVDRSVLCGYCYCCFGHLVPRLYIVPRCLRKSVNGVRRGLGRLSWWSLVPKKWRCHSFWLVVQTGEMFTWGGECIHTKRLVRVRGCVWKERSREKKTKRNNLPPFLPEVDFLGEKTDQEEKGRRWLWIFSRTTYKWISDDLSVFPGVKCPYTLSTFSISAFVVPCHHRLALVFHSLRLVPMGKHNRIHRSASLFLSPLFYHTLGLLLFIQSNPKHSTVSLLGCCHVWFVMTIVILLLSMLSFLPSPHHTFLVHPLIDHPTHLRNSILWWPFMPGKENE